MYLKFFKSTYPLSILAIFALFVAFEFILPTQAMAISSDILVGMTPPNPAPFENTTITLSSYANDLDTVLISWSLNGKNSISGIGKKSFSTTAPASGSIATVTAKIALPDGEIEKSITIRSNVLVLLWQANDSYVPPFYRGKALPSLGSEIKVVAMPEIRNEASTVSPQNMTYAWKKDYTNDVEGSGYGKNFFTYTNDYLDNSNSISVVASTIDQNNSSQATINVGAVEPKILFYKNDSKLGIVWDQALPNTHRIQASELVTAIPYFISPKELRHPSLIWNWFINDNPINISGFKKNVIPLQVESGTSGTSRVKLQIDNQDKIFQTVSKEINIEF